MPNTLDELIGQPTSNVLDDYFDTSDIAPDTGPDFSLFDEDTAGTLPLPWLRGHAPEGGEWSYEQESKQKQVELEEAIKKIEEE